MSAYFESNKTELGRGNRKPANLYEGSKKITGYKTITVTEPNFVIEDGYNDKLQGSIYGKSEQSSNEASLNILDLNKLVLTNTYGTYSLTETGVKSIITSDATALRIQIAYPSEYFIQNQQYIFKGIANKTITNFRFGYGSTGSDTSELLGGITTGEYTFTYENIENKPYVVILAYFSAEIGEEFEYNYLEFKEYENKDTDYTPYYPASPSPGSPSDIFSLGDKVNLFDKDDYTILDDTFGFKCNLKIGETYTFSSNLNIRWIKISNYSSGYGSVQIANEDGFNDFTFTMSKNENIPDEDTQYIFIGLIGDDNFISEISELDDYLIQIQKGTTATQYTPYGERLIKVESVGKNETSTTEILLDEPNSSIGDVKDTIDLMSGVQTKSVGTLVLDGTEDWINTVTSDKTCVFAIHLTILTQFFEDNEKICNYFVARLNSNWEDDENGMWTSEYQFQIRIEKIYATSVSEFKSWLAEKYAEGNPVIVQYKLAEPYENQLDFTQPETFYGQNNVSITSNLVPEVEITYRNMDN